MQHVTPCFEGVTFCWSGLTLRTWHLVFDVSRLLCSSSSSSSRRGVWARRRRACSLMCTRFTVHWRRDDKQAADEDALLSGAHSPVSSSPRSSPWKSLINAQAWCVPPARGADEFQPAVWHRTCDFQPPKHWSRVSERRGPRLSHQVFRKGSARCGSSSTVRS